MQSTGARESPAEPAFPCVARSHTPLRNPVYVYVYVYVHIWSERAWLCGSERREATGAAKARRAVGERRLESKFLSSHVNRDVAGAIEGLSIYFYIPFLKRFSCALHILSIFFLLLFFKYFRASEKSHRDTISRERARWIIHDTIINSEIIIKINLVQAKSDQSKITNWLLLKTMYHCYIAWMGNYTFSKNLEYIS